MFSPEEAEDLGNTGLAQKVDWIHLTANTTTVSLWDSLHDAELIAIGSDLLARTVILSFQIRHLNTFHKLRDECLFWMELSGVSSARATRWVPWPGEFQLPQGISRIEESRLINEYHAKWREESQSWSSVEEQISSGNVSGLEISNARLALGPDAIALRLDTQSEDHGHQILTIAAEKLRIRRTTDVDLSVEEFVGLGQAYWSAFAARSDQRLLSRVDE